jgi:hypothetical protein
MGGARMRARMGARLRACERALACVCECAHANGEGEKRAKEKRVRGKWRRVSA